MFAQASKRSPLLFKCDTGRNVALKRCFLLISKKFLKKFFVNYLAPKNIKKKQKYCMETMDKKFAKPLIFGRSRGVDKVIFDCYNEVAPRKIGAHN